MLINTEGIVLRQVKISGGRKMILMFTKKYGKISAGSNLGEKGKSKAALAVRPFSLGNYELFKNRDYYNINSADVKKSFYGLGENIDKYMFASYVMEVTEKMIPEEMPQPKLFNLLEDFLTAMEKRNSRYETLVLAYETKALQLLGTFPQMDECVSCGEKNDLTSFSVRGGGMICKSCAQKINDSLIYEPKFDIVNILKYFSKRPIDGFEKIALEDKTAGELQSMLREYMSYHLDIKELKSESIFKVNF